MALIKARVSLLDARSVDQSVSQSSGCAIRLKQSFPCRLNACCSISLLLPAKPLLVVMVFLHDIVENNALETSSDGIELTT